MRRLRDSGWPAAARFTAAAVLFVGLAVARPAAFAGDGFPPWRGREHEIERFLEQGEVLAREDVGMGVTKPFKVTLGLDGQTLDAVWKPLRRGFHDGYWESYQAEVIAYRLSRMLGLDMVPPTVARQIGITWGSLQMWVDGCELYRDLKGESPDPLGWSRQMSRMKVFDNLLYNLDRNAGNFLVDPEWRVVLIDHSRSILYRRQLDTRKAKLPTTYDRGLLERLRELDAAALETGLGSLVERAEVKGLLARRDQLLEHAQRLIVERGEGVLFGE